VTARKTIVQRSRTCLCDLSYDSKRMRGIVIQHNGDSQTEMSMYVDADTSRERQKSSEHVAKADACTRQPRSRAAALPTGVLGAYR
jgi:hypothetical protein